MTLEEFNAKVDIAKNTIKTMVKGYESKQEVITLVAEYEEKLSQATSVEQLENLVKEFTTKFQSVAGIDQAIANAKKEIRDMIELRYQNDGRIVALVKEYDEKLTYAKSTEEITFHVEQFRSEYNAIKVVIESERPANTCASSASITFVSTLSALSLMVLVLRKKH